MLIRYKCFAPLLMFLFSFTSQAFALDLQCGAPWKECTSLAFPNHLIFKVPFRAGYIEASGQVPFKGNILYFEGLADSMRNHLPLFTVLSEAGYRVIAFDYMGQGGSDGTMCDTRIEKIADMGDLVWKRFARDLAHFPKKTVIGWSTGGLAAYSAAAKNRLDRTILIAPGIYPKAVVKITEESLTSARYPDKSSDPHLDPIPITIRSPLEVAGFATNLVNTAALARGAPIGNPLYLVPGLPAQSFDATEGWKIPARIQGLVLLSGPNDKYVYSPETEGIIHVQAPGFSVKTYENALHEIDNEQEEIRDQADQDILHFLNATQ